MVIKLVYVDDLLITGSNPQLVNDAKKTLQRQFKVKNLGELRYFLGIEVLRSQKGILLNQRKYALELISGVGLSGSKPVSTPLELNQKLTTLEYDAHVGKLGDPELGDITAYQKLIGKLLYLTITRPDISFAVQTLSQFMQSPKQSHMDAALWVVKYIKGAPGLGVLLHAKPIDSLTAYCDAYWAVCPNTMRSMTRYIVKLGSSLISWKSKKQQTINMSSTKAEYRSMAAVAAEVTWLSGLLDELGISISKPIQLFCDNKAAIQIAENPIFHERTKHIEIDCHFVL
ncbi:uncharacterized mitochondrial protein AtMg00810-like [Nicotiana tomentosiformis]|uniref:uncharacterized mitochondrial protein AtMg00810-like n=1 Tax=Nicotiana tomentosiformis TaxID=4098 RepID=UPI000878B367|nr:uncharacterized mitochondrial protein AtMg00810-like [Nicotiana tomentosiformis]